MLDVGIALITFAVFAFFEYITSEDQRRKASKQAYDRVYYAYTPWRKNGQ